MERSRINNLIRQSDEFISSFGFHLPPFAYLQPDEYRTMRAELGDVINHRLGWDITDYGKNAFYRLGLVLFTLRNGTLDNLKTGQGMCYAEKIMISREDQISPMHRHITKTEDIINRGGATLAIKMYESDEHGQLDEKKPVVLKTDGQEKKLPAGEVWYLDPGQSVTLKPGNWHEFWGEGGDVLIGEVSTVNDDINDNIFLEPLPRFSDIEEDEKPDYLLVSDYEKWGLL